MTSPDPSPSRRPFPVAAGLVMLYAGILQSGFAVSMLVQAFSYSFEKEIAIPAISLVLSLCGQIGMGYSAAAKRSVAMWSAVWIAGSLGTLYGFTLLEVTSVWAIAIGVLQLTGGPIAFALIARSLPDARTPARREIGALLLVVAIGHAFGAVWSFVSTLRMFGLGSMSAGSVLGLSVSPALALLVSGLAVRASLSLLDGRESARRRLTLWKWFSIGTSCGLAVLSVVSVRLSGHDLPLAFVLHLLVQAVLACVLPLALDRLGRRALAVPIEPQDVHAVPTVYAWSALWFVPTLLCAAVLTRMTFASSLLDGDTVGESRISIVGACCGVAAVLLLATALSVLRAHSVARLLGRITATLALCALCYLMYAAMQIEPRNYTRAMIPVGVVAVFTAAMVALAWFEARRERYLAPARVVA